MGGMLGGGMGAIGVGAAHPFLSTMQQGVKSALGGLGASFSTAQIDAVSAQLETVSAMQCMHASACVSFRTHNQNTCAP